MKKKVLALVLASAMVLSLAACGGSSSSSSAPAEEAPAAEEAAPAEEEASVGNGSAEDVQNAENVTVEASGDVMTGEVTLTVMNQSSLTTMDPMHSGSMVEDNIMRMLFDTLAVEDVNNGYVDIPMLANTWELSEDKLTWTFHLRDDVTYPDGEKFTADDVLYTYERYNDPDIQAGGNFAYFMPSLQIVSCDVIDDYTVSFTTEQPIPGFLESIDEFYIMPRHHYEGLSNDEAAMNPMGSGAFEFVEWAMDDHLTIKRRTDNWEDVKTNVTTIVYRTVPEASTRVSELMTADLSAGATIVDKMNSDLKGQVEGSGNVYLTVASGTRQYIGLVQYHENIWAEKLARQAANYAVDFNTIRDALLDGYGQRVVGMVPSDPNPNLTAYPYDPEKAKELLDEAGIVDSDGDGVREYNGAPVALKFATCAGRYIKDVEMAQTVGQYLSEVGLPCEVVTYEWSVYTQKLEDHEYEEDLFFIGSGPAWTASGDLTDYYGKSGGNYAGWYNDEYDEKYLALCSSFDEEECQKLNYECQEIFYDEAPIIFLYNPPLYYGMSSNLEWTGITNGRMYMKDAIVHVK